MTNIYSNFGNFFANIKANEHALSSIITFNLYKTKMEEM